MKTGGKFDWVPCGSGPLLPFGAVGGSLGIPTAFGPLPAAKVPLELLVVL